jgi:hypothetical protein
MTVTVRNFAARTPCNSESELLGALSLLKGKSVSIEYKKPSGLRHVDFVSVTCSGDIYDSYTNEPYDIAPLFQ